MNFSDPRMSILLLAIMTLTAFTRSSAISLSDILESTMRNNPEILRSKSSSKSQVDRLRQQGSSPNPEINLGGGVKQTPQGNGPILTVGARQALTFWGPQSGRQKVAALEDESSALRLRGVRADLTRQIIELAGDHVLAKRLWKDALERQRRLVPVKVLMNTQTFASPQQRIDKAVIEARLLNLESEQSTLIAEVTATARALGGVAGIDMEHNELSWEFPGMDAMSLEPIPSLEHVLAQNTDLALARLTEAQSITEIDIAQRTGTSEPGLSLSYGHENAGGGEHSFLLGLDLQLPFSDYNRLGMDAAENSRAAAVALQDSLKQRITAQWNALQSRKKGLDATASIHSPKAVDRVVLQLADAELQLKRGQIALISYLELEDQLVRMRMIMDDNALKMVDLLAEFQALAGGDSIPSALAH